MQPADFFLFLSSWVTKQVQIRSCSKKHQTKCSSAQRVNVIFMLTVFFFYQNSDCTCSVAQMQSWRLYGHTENQSFILCSRQFQPSESPHISPISQVGRIKAGSVSMMQVHEGQKCSTTWTVHAVCTQNYIHLCRLPAENRKTSMEEMTAIRC